MKIIEEGYRPTGNVDRANPPNNPPMVGLGVKNENGIKGSDMMKKIDDGKEKSKRTKTFSGHYHSINSKLCGIHCSLTYLTNLTNRMDGFDEEKKEMRSLSDEAKEILDKCEEIVNKMSSIYKKIDKESNSDES